MSEKSNESLFKKQKSTKSKIEDVINATLEGNALKNAQDFILYLRENKMTPGWASTSSWKANYKGKSVCYIRLPGAATIEDGSWHLALFAQYDGYLNELIASESEEIKALVKNHIDKNLPCGGCMPGLDRMSVNKEFSNICACTCINIKNPDEYLCGFAKKLIALRRSAVTDGRVPKCDYVKPADRK